MLTRVTSLIEVIFLLLNKPLWQQDFTSAHQIMMLSRLNNKKKNNRSFVSADGSDGVIDVCPQRPRSIKLTAAKSR